MVNLKETILKATPPMKRSILALLLSASLLACSTSPLDTQITDTNKKEVLEAINTSTSVSEEDKKLLAEYTLRHAIEALMNSTFAGEKTDPNNEDEILKHFPSGKSAREMIAEQKDFKTKNPNANPFGKLEEMQKPPDQKGQALQPPPLTLPSAKAELTPPTQP